MDKLVPRLLSFGRNLEAGEVFEIGCSVEDRGGLLPERLGGFVADARLHADHAFESRLIARVDGEFEECGDILDMGLLEKSKPAGDAKGDASSCELELHLHRVVVGAVEDGDLLERHALVREFHDALRDEGRLLVVIRQGNERGLHRMRLAHGREVFWKLVFVCENGGVGDIQNARHAAVVCFDFEDLRPGVCLGKTQDVFKIRPAPGVDALGIVAYDHHIPVVCCKKVDEFGLEAVGVLILIDEDVLKLALVLRGDVGLGQEKFEGLGEEVVEVHRVCLLFSRFVGGLNAFDVLGEGNEVSVFFDQHFGYGEAGVDRVAENVGKHSSFWESLVGGNNALLGHDGCDHVLGVLAVHDAESLAEPHSLGVSAEDAVADRVECAAPEPIGGAGDECVHPLGHFTRGFVRESEEQDGAGGHALFQNPSHAVGQCACLSTPGTGNDQRRTTGRCHSSKLLLVEFRGIVDAAGGGRRRLQCVGAGHAGFSFARCAARRAWMKGCSVRRREAWPTRRRCGILCSRGRPL